MQAPSATEAERRALAKLIPAQPRLQQPTIPAMEAKQSVKLQLNATKIKTKTTEVSDESSSMMSGTRANPALKSGMQKDFVLADTEWKDSEPTAARHEAAVAVQQPRQDTSEAGEAGRAGASVQSRQLIQPTKAMRPKAAKSSPAG
ncbi:hypothetical protein PR003_g19302 [Phytophthora rubi]|uniref:Uncharacterized protein n=1 Tax=Phytophthora rubi TaxID=129364 RepID=A0A6A3KBL3_9STRA|nr:hypothetical protein PR002_g17911 [Phytophthora rubi]KAE9002384.1 hypothetical protein PR001_g18269 [Phytophthora rubi]KAE9314213.1 hypothetical protein PR003_g19302 [Phytophthora rubi]